jgi:hypothetical protein
MELGLIFCAVFVVELTRIALARDFEKFRNTTIDAIESHSSHFG